ncbi:hypothetical protein [Microvirga yunnanensis]|uniref:hypothetical protein n=1 Tax=Microvirga yunnanensis TaxID=2953740 RepID=UPI0021C61467|nr:hypothetical protein [Microvirga sp. HBU65207]
MGGGYVRLTLLGTPLVQIDPRTNAVVAIFKGTGWGDALRFGVDRFRYRDIRSAGSRRRIETFQPLRDGLSMIRGTETDRE